MSKFLKRVSLKRVVSKPQSKTQCNYSDNYYGDQVCVATRTTTHKS